MRTAVNNAFDGECVDQNGDERRENIRDGLAEEDLLDRQEARQDENARKEDDLAKDRKRQRDFDDAHARKAVHNLVLHAKQHGAERVNTDESRRHGNVFGFFGENACKEMRNGLRGERHEGAKADRDDEDVPLRAKDFLRTACA